MFYHVSIKEALYRNAECLFYHLNPSPKLNPSHKK